MVMKIMVVSNVNGNDNGDDDDGDNRHKDDWKS